MSRKYIIGRKGDIRLSDKSVSRQHAELTVSHDEIRLRDLNSANGIYIVKNKRLIRFFDGFVQLNQAVVIGSRQYSIHQLISMVSSHAA